MPAPAPRGPDRQQEGPPLAAQFGVSTTVSDSAAVLQDDWYLLRGPERIERIRPDSGTAEIWERDDRGEVSLKRVFRSESRIVEYTPGNLRAMQVEARWEALGAAIDSRVLHTLERGAVVHTPFGPATVFEGVLAGVITEIWWLDALRLPVRIVEQRQSTRVRIDLKALHLKAPPDWPRADLDEHTSVESIDVADLGDRHYDPFVRKVEMADAVLRGLGFWNR